MRRRGKEEGERQQKKNEQEAPSLSLSLSLPPSLSLLLLLLLLSLSHTPASLPGSPAAAPAGGAPVPSLSPARMAFLRCSSSLEVYLSRTAGLPNCEGEEGGGGKGGSRDEGDEGRVRHTHTHTHTHTHHLSHTHIPPSHLQGEGHEKIHRCLPQRRRRLVGALRGRRQQDRRELGQRRLRVRPDLVFQPRERLLLDLGVGVAQGGWGGGEGEE